MEPMAVVIGVEEAEGEMPNIYSPQAAQVQCPARGPGRRRRPARHGRGNLKPLPPTFMALTGTYTRFQANYNFGKNGAL